MIRRFLITIFSVILITTFTVVFAQQNVLFTEEYNRGVLRQQQQQQQQQQQPQPNRKNNQYENETDVITRQLQLYTVDAETNYRIVENDILTISYMDRVDEKKAKFQVSPTGEIELPLVGKVKVLGLNQKQARETISDLFKEYIRDPRVSLAINVDGKIMVLGQVSSPGSYKLSQQMTLMDGVLEAGGFDKKKAEPRSILVMRGTPENPIVLNLDLKKMMTKGDRRDNILLKPGDLVFVPQSFISNAQDFWDGFIYKYLLNWYGLGGQPPFNSAGGSG